VNKIFIANRGEIACRIASTAHRMNIQTCGIFTPQDARTKHVRTLQELTQLPPGELTENYLNQELLLSIARNFGADAVHPGYGFVSENPDFAQKVLKAGLIWIGPSPDAMRKLGGKIEAKEIAEKAGVPVPPWIRLRENSSVKEVLDHLQLPVLIKAAHGGGGRGQRVVREVSQFEEALRAARSESLRSFGSAEVFVEKFLERPRHIEVQILADTQEHIFAIGERDCTLQRRNQKVIEESPASILDDQTRIAIHEAAKKLAAAAGYTNAGTIEFLAQQNANQKWEFFFMEMNARLQVEHPVTEMVTGLDLVELQIRVARGENLLPLLMEGVSVMGHSIELRLCAENPANNFLPTPGPLTDLRFPDDSSIRIDSGFEAGDVIPQEYDSLFAKLIVSAPDRKSAIKQMMKALDQTLIAGTITNKFYLDRVLKHPDFKNNKIHTRWIESHPDLMKEGSPELDQDLIAWGKIFSSELLVQRIEEFPQRRINAHILKGFKPDPLVHGTISPQGLVRIAGNFELENETAYASGWVSRFEICLAFTREIHGTGQGKISFAGQYESDDLRAHHGPIIAQVPGVVLEVRANSNDTVAALQPILIVEAMKIEMPFSLPIPAKILMIHVKAGDRIVPGQTLVTWEPVE
jgi:3-methylcrotonyl-CoA carboxylase alpha subunit